MRLQRVLGLKRLPTEWGVSGTGPRSGHTVHLCFIQTLYTGEDSVRCFNQYILTVTYCIKLAVGFPTMASGCCSKDENLGALENELPEREAQPVMFRFSVLVDTLVSAYR